MKKKILEGEDESENEFDVDEPEELQGASDDDEWTPSNNRESGGRRQSSRLRTATKKARFVDPLSSDDDDDDLEEDSSEDDKRRKGKTKTSFGRGRGAASIKPTIKVRTPSTLMSPTTPVNVERSEATSTTTCEKEFGSGAFIVLRNEYQKKDNPPIWKIDGKALLQKYIPFTQDGKTLYKNTSTYSGWSLSNKDQYYPAPVVFKSQDKKEIIVEFMKDGVKEDDVDD